MRKKFLLVFALMGSVIASATAASAASVDMYAPSSQKSASRQPAAAKLAISQSGPGQQLGQFEQQETPQGTQPKVKKKRRFLGFPLFGLLAAGGAVAVAADGCSCANPASP